MCAAEEPVCCFLPPPGIVMSVTELPQQLRTMVELDERTPHGRDANRQASCCGHFGKSYLGATDA